jgi:hypothetical protein
MKLTSSVILAFPTLILAQSSSDFPACSPNAKKPTWTIEDHNYNWTNFQRKNGSPYSMILSNTARPFNASCPAALSSYPLEPPKYNSSMIYFEDWYPCALPKEESIPSDVVWFKFSVFKKPPVAQLVEVKQSYTCWEDVGPTL